MTHISTCYHHIHTASTSDGDALTETFAREARRTQLACDVLTQQMTTLLVEQCERTRGFGQ